MSTRRVCTFHVGELLLGVDVGIVQEVLGEQPMTPVPLADPSVRGLLNLRGQIVTAIDARRRLGLRARRGDHSMTNVVIRTAHEPMSLVVDTEGEVVDVADSDIEPLPENVDETIRTFVTGSCKLEQSLLLMLDAERLFTLERALI